jgi:hypothetical protein
MVSIRLASEADARPTMAMAMAFWLSRKFSRASLGSDGKPIGTLDRDAPNAAFRARNIVASDWAILLEFVIKSEARFMALIKTGSWFGALRDDHVRIGISRGKRRRLQRSRSKEC